MTIQKLTQFRFARRSAIIGKSVFDHTPGTIAFNSGAAYPPCLPDVVNEAIQAVQHREEAMQYAPLMGIDDLRQEICNFVADDEIIAQPENVLVTNGSKNAFDLALRCFCEAGDKVIVTRPTYMTAIHIMRTHNVELIDIGQDEDGFDTDELEAKLIRMEANAQTLPKLLFDIPDFHNPTGITTAHSRRKKMLALAQRYNFVICEDDPYRRIRFEGVTIPSIKSMDKSGHVISLGTVSKILAPGLRVGWAIGDAGVVRRMAMQKADGGSNAFAQRIVVQLMQTNKIIDHIEQLIPQMRIHRNVMIEAFRTHIPEASIRTPEGGYFLWAELHKNIDAENLVELGIKEGVEVSSGRLSFPNDDPGNFIRMAYSFTNIALINEGIEKLGVAYRKMNSQANRL